MANEVNITVTAADKASGVFNSIEKSGRGLGKTLGDVGKIAGGFVLAQGIIAAPSFFTSAAQAAADDAASVAKLQKAVENSGAAWETYSGQLDETIKAAQKRGFTDDQARDALALLTAQTGDATEAQKRFVLAQDLARGANIDVYTASKLLGKVTEENVNVLARYGIVVQEGATETELFGLLQAKFGGQAETFAKSTAGQMASAKIQMGELKESIGYAVLPVIAKLADVTATQLIPAIQKLAAEWGPRLQAAFAQAKKAISPVTDVIGKLFGTLSNKDIAMIFGALAAAIVAGFVAIAAAAVVSFIATNAALLGIPIAIAAVAVAVGLLVSHWDAIKAKTLEVWGSISDFLNEKFGFMKGLFETAFTYYKYIAIFVFEEIKNYIETTINVIKDVINIAMALLQGDWGAAWNAMKQLVSDVWEGIKGAIMPAVDLIRGQLQLLWDVTEGIRGFLADKFQPVWIGLSWVLGAVQGVLGGLQDAFQWVIDRVYDLKDAVNDALGPLGDLIDKAGDLIGKMGDLGGGVKDKLGFASGGVTPYSGLFTVGERGPELVALPGGSRVYSNSDSQRMVSQGGGSNNSKSYTFYGPLVVQPQTVGDMWTELDRALR